MLKRLFAVLAKCESPFCEELVTQMKAFGFSLLPFALFATIGETLSTAFPVSYTHLDVYKRQAYNIGKAPFCQGDFLLFL